jgi:hypothetical protein
MEINIYDVPLYEEATCHELLESTCIHIRVALSCLKLIEACVSEQGKKRKGGIMYHMIDITVVLCLCIV